MTGSGGSAFSIQGDLRESQGWDCSVVRVENTDKIAKAAHCSKFMSRFQVTR